MIDSQQLIILPMTYDSERREFIRDAFRIEFNSQSDTQQRYFKTTIVPLLNQNAHRFSIPGATKVEFEIDAFVNDKNLMRDFLKQKDKGKKPRRFGDRLVKVFDAFLQLRIPGYDSAFEKQGAADGVGQILGTYLRDQSALKDRYQQALNVESIFGLYEYDEVDTHHKYSGSTRVLAFLSGKSIDYLKVIDFFMNQNKHEGTGQRERLNIISGFCIPGRSFSPVIMRSETYKTRHLGLLYTPGNLIDMVGGVLDDLTYEVFTTEENKEKVTLPTKSTAHDELFKKALNIHYGPKLRRNLRVIKEKSYKIDIERKIDLILSDMI